MEIQNIELHRVVSTAIIYKDGKYLIVQRSPNKKTFPRKKRREIEMSGRTRLKVMVKALANLRPGALPVVRELIAKRSAE